MWMSADLLAQRQFSASWIPVLNGLTRLAVYSLIAWLVASLRGTLQREQRLARHGALKEFSPVSVSVGIAWFKRAASFDTMVKAADGLMYEIKESGKHGAQTRRFAAAPVQHASAAAPDRAL